MQKAKWHNNTPISANNCTFDVPTKLPIFVFGSCKDVVRMPVSIQGLKPQLAISQAGIEGSILKLRSSVETIATGR